MNTIYIQVYNLYYESGDCTEVQLELVSVQTPYQKKTVNKKNIKQEQHEIINRNTEEMMYCYK